ncbi:hypothetical protein D6764_04345 [Candidatus Woesearchaeota archaeon]|nr:MAG: hypothetical protein D6764_04345 [Candidatus Woesearchaeota archaeon]
MATVLDLTLLEGFSSIFSFLLIFTIIYALLVYTKFLGDNKSLHAIIALSFSVIMLFTPRALEAVKIMVPWFMLFILAGVFVLLVYKLFGAPDSSIEWTVRNYGGLKWGIFIVSVIIIAGSLGYVYSQPAPGTAPQEGNSTILTAYQGDVGSTGEEALLATIFHPKVLGMVVTLLIAVFTISLLSQSPK